MHEIVLFPLISSTILSILLLIVSEFDVIEFERLFKLVEILLKSFVLKTFSVLSHTRTVLLLSSVDDSVVDVADDKLANSSAFFA